MLADLDIRTDRFGRRRIFSIKFITKDGKIKDIFDMQPFSTASKTSTGYVRYALEVPQGWYKKNGIKTGDVLKIDF